MPKLRFLLSILLLVSMASLVCIPLVSPSSGYIRIGGKSPSYPGQQVQAGTSVNLYFGEVYWSGTQVYLLLSHDNTPQASVGDLVYTPSFLLSHVTNPSMIVSYTSEQGSWVVGDNWINGTVSQNVPVGNYSIKAFDQASDSVALTDVFISIYTVIYSATLQATPPSGPGGVTVQFTGSGFPPSSLVTVSYFDPAFGSWNFLTNANADYLGKITFATQIPDLRKSLGIGDIPEGYTQVSYRAEINGVVYCYANYNEYSRGLKTVGGQTATGLFGNGTNLSSSVIAVSGNNLTISGKWFHPNDVVYVRWDGKAIVGTVTGNEWLSAEIIGTSIANAEGYFVASITIPTADAGAHFLSIEDSQTKVIVTIYVSSAYLSISPTYGPGGISVQFTGLHYPASSSITIAYQDPTFGTWNPLGSTTSDAAGALQFSAQMPDLRKSVGSGDYSEATNPLYFRTEGQGLVYAYANYNEYARGLKTVGSQTASGLFGNGTNFSSSIIVNSGDSLTISGKWFHPSDVIYVRWDGTAVVGTVNGDQWLNAAIIGSSIADGGGYFAAAVTIPPADVGPHFLSIEDSQTKVIITVSLGQNIPPPKNRASSVINLSCQSSTTYTGFKVTINGQLSFANQTGISGAQVNLSSSSNGGNSWQPLTLVYTGSDGSFSAQWMPSVSGNYLIKAEYSGTLSINQTSQIVSLAVAPYSNQVFSVISNSTVSVLSFDSTNYHLSFTASGVSGTTGFMDVAIAKTLVSDPGNIQVTIDGAPTQYTTTSTTDSWFLHFTYTHSTHNVVVDLGQVIPEFPSILSLVLIVAATSLSIVLRPKKIFQSQTQMGHRNKS